MKCYLMYHIHVFEDETKDYKIIGVFTSYDKALDVKGKYSSELVGFKDYPSGFCIEEFEVVGLDVAKQRTVYVIFNYIYKDGEEEELLVIKIVRNKKEFKRISKRLQKRRNTRIYKQNGRRKILNKFNKNEICR